MVNCLSGKKKMEVEGGGSGVCVDSGEFWKEQENGNSNSLSIIVCVFYACDLWMVWEKEKACITPAHTCITHSISPAHPPLPPIHAHHLLRSCSCLQLLY